MVAMKAIVARATNCLIWIICGVLVIAIRIWILHSSSILLWEVLGFGMIAYGLGKLLWVLARGRLPSSIP